MKKTIILYITDKNIYINNKQEIIAEKLPSEVVVDNRLNNSEKFYTVFKNLLKKYKLNDSLLSKKIKIISMPNYLKSDQELLISIMERLSFNNPHFIKYNSIVTNNFINILDDKIILTYQNQNFIIYLNIGSLNVIKKLILNIFTNEKEVYLIGNKDQVITLKKELEDKIKCYSYEDSEQYIIKHACKET